ncbi:Uma2 family endonuclease [Pantanalinema sp. GBBB05]|uniref:Uma2 family endonuclease n=1 Tax=Pantanalinema sp. GBBB05 TaxID=2604139 RepID=UPI001E016EBC|nr:Uma2 family endonuclease [Pantanalinema sp. GBBB05]
MTAYSINLNPIITLTDEQFYQLCQVNPELKFERTANGELMIMSPTGGETGNYNVEIATDVALWNRQTQQGITFDSSTGFKLPNGADRSPDVAWIRRDRWNTLTPAQKKRFPPICPDFVIELRSATDELQPLQTKMQEYLDNGLQLGWLINPQDQQVEIYRPGQPVEVLPTPSVLSGNPVLPGFKLHLDWLWTEAS